MGSLEYVSILEAHTGCPARLLVVELDGAVVAYPFLLRPVSALRFAAGIGESLWDTFTPEYTGPISIGAARDPQAGRSLLGEAFAGYGRENGVVAEFAHMNPWRAAHELLDSAYVADDRELVYIDLSAGKERTWTRSLTSDARRMARRAQAAGVRVRRAETPDDVREFHRLYISTMDRRRARERYYFPLEHFLAFLETMRETAFFVLAEWQGRTVAGGLYLYGGTDVYWHLSAMDMRFAHVAAVNGYVWETICWAIDAGKERMLLGGGYAPGDGIFRFKAGFSPLRARFRTYQRVHDADAHAALVHAWSASHGGRAAPEGYFPSWRAEAE